MRFRFFIIISCFIQTFAFAQKTGFEARTSATSIPTNGRFQVSFILSNLKPQGRLKEPSLSDFIVESGPNESQQMEMVNGNVTQSLSVDYVLRPRRKGTFVIGEATVVAQGQTYHTQPIKIEVSDSPVGSASATPVPKNAKGDVFLFAAFSSKEAYVGQGIVVDYKVYSAVALDQIKPISMPTYPGFTVEKVENFDNSQSVQVLNGKRYMSKTIHRVILYPLQSGTLGVEAMEMEGLSMGFGMDVINFGCDATTIKVKDLPAGAPANFSGAVGKWTATASVEKQDISTDDVVPIRVLLRGDGGLKQVQPQALNLPNGLRAFDPKIINEESNENGGRIVSTKEIEYLVQANQVGAYTISPTFSYFDTQKGTYETINMTNILLNVKQGTGVALDTNKHLENEKNTSDFGKTLAWIAAILGVLVVSVLSFIYYKNKQKIKTPQVREVFNHHHNDENNTQKEETKTINNEDDLTRFQQTYAPTQAHEVVETKVEVANNAQTQSIENDKIPSELVTLKQALSSENSALFYGELDAILKKTALQKYSLNFDSVSKIQIISHLRENNVSEQSSEQFAMLSDTCLMARYGGATNPERMQTHFEQLSELLKNI